MSLEEVRAAAREIGAKRTALVHLTDAVAEALADAPIDGVIATEDGTAIEI